MFPVTLPRVVMKLGTVDSREALPSLPLDDPMSSEELEQIRWFVLPDEARADLLSRRGPARAHDAS